MGWCGKQHFGQRLGQIPLGWASSLLCWARLLLVRMQFGGVGEKARKQKVKICYFISRKSYKPKAYYPKVTGHSSLIWSRMSKFPRLLKEYLFQVFAV